VSLPLVLLLVCIICELFAVILLLAAILVKR
jgi:hypothetical protein